MKTNLINQETQLSDWGLAFVYAQGKPLLAHDFCGYLVEYKNRSKVGIGVDLCGNVFLFSKTSKPLSDRTINKVLKHLLKIGFITTILEPFPEVSEKYNLSFDPFNATVIDGPCFVGSSK